MFFKGTLDSLGCFAEFAYHWSVDVGYVCTYINTDDQPFSVDTIDNARFADLEDVLWYVSGCFRAYADGELLVTERDGVFEFRFRLLSEPIYAYVATSTGRERRMVLRPERRQEF